MTGLQDRRKAPESADAAGDAGRSRIVRTRGALSIVAAALIGAAWAWPVDDTPLELYVGTSGHAALRSATFEDAEGVEFTMDGLLANVEVTTHGVAIPVVGVKPSDLEDSYGRPRSNERRHSGIDIGAPRRTPVAAALDGWILSVTNGATGGLGLHMVDRTGTWLLYYAHLDQHAPGLFNGQAVRRGELIGYVGTTGNARGWPHLHFEVGRLVRPGQISARTVNPYDFLTGKVVVQGSARGGT
jgi:peptidoglycan LD-endopeptidase LytH